MILEALGSASARSRARLGCVHRLSTACPPAPWCSRRASPEPSFGDFVTHSALGPGSFLPSLLGAAVVSAASLSLLLRPADDSADDPPRPSRSA